MSISNKRFQGRSAALIIFESGRNSIAWKSWNDLPLVKILSHYSYHSTYLMTPLMLHLTPYAAESTECLMLEQHRWDIDNEPQPIQETIETIGKIHKHIHIIRAT